MVETTKLEEIIRDLGKSPKQLEQLTLIGSLQEEIEVIINQIEHSTT
jgi:hypothetical protein